MTLTIRVFDDSPKQRNEWSSDLDELLGERAIVKPMEDGDMTEVMDVLERRRRAARDGGGDWLACELIDGCDIFVVDFDLLDGEPAIRRETGERVAYLARFYSECLYVVALNQFSTIESFDLRLRGHLESFADLNISEVDLLNPRLWGIDDTETAYRPWVWPTLLSEPDRIRRAAEDLPGAALLESLGLLVEDRGGIPSQHTSWLGGEAESATAEDLLTRSRLGLHPRDSPCTYAGVRRLSAAARLSKWLNRLVRVDQQPFADAPHLIAQIPGAGGDVVERNCYSDVADTMQIVLEELHAEALGAPWFDRPVWPIDVVRDRLRAGDLPLGTEDVQSLFLEDRSCFVPQDEAQRYDAKLHPSTSRLRYVSSPMVEGVEYHPLDWLFSA